MTVRVDRTPEGFDTAEPTVIVTTTDATGQERRYRVRLTDDETFDDGRLMAGRRIDPQPLTDDPCMTDRAYAAARRAFESRGFEVHGGSTDD